MKYARFLSIPDRVFPPFADLIREEQMFDIERMIQAHVRAYHFTYTEGDIPATNLPTMHITIAPRDGVMWFSPELPVTNMEPDFTLVWNSPCKMVVYDTTRWWAHLKTTPYQPHAPPTWVPPTPDNSSRLRQKLLALRNRRSHR